MNALIPGAQTDQPATASDHPMQRCYVLTQQAPRARRRRTAAPDRRSRRRLGGGDPVRPAPVTSGRHRAAPDRLMAARRLTCSSRRSRRRGRGRGLDSACPAVPFAGRGADGRPNADCNGARQRNRRAWVPGPYWRLEPAVAAGAATPGPTAARPARTRRARTTIARASGIRSGPSKRPPRHLARPTRTGLGGRTGPERCESERAVDRAAFHPIGPDTGGSEPGLLATRPSQDPAARTPVRPDSAAICDNLATRSWSGHRPGRSRPRRAEPYETLTT